MSVDWSHFCLMLRINRMQRRAKAIGKVDEGFYRVLQEQGYKGHWIESAVPRFNPCCNSMLPSAYVDGNMIPMHLDGRSPMQSAIDYIDRGCVPELPQFDVYVCAHGVVHSEQYPPALLRTEYAVDIFTLASTYGGNWHHSHSERIVVVHSRRDEEIIIVPHGTTFADILELLK